MTDQLQGLTASLAGRYAIECELGRGGMATVYLARDLKHHRPVAVKALHPELSAAIGRERFLQEIEVAAGLRHPHILPLHDSGDADGTLYYVMPYVEGESLRDKLAREKQLAIDEALHITREVADALAFAHAKGIIHRDIKPANILLESNHAVVADFGVALVLHATGSGRLTGTGLSPGTPEYMSPEQAAGERDIDARSDLYSLGCLLYEMLTGDPPFTGTSPYAVLARKRSEPVRGLRVVRPTVTPALERVVLKALAGTPADRYRSVAEFANALESVSAPGAPPEGLVETDAEPVARRESAVRPVSTWRSLGIGSATLLGGLALVTAIGLLTTLAYDVKLAIPSQFTPSRTDFPLIGIRALMPVLIFGFLVLVAYVVLEYLIRALGLGLRRVPRLGPRLEAVTRRSTDTWHRFWWRLTPGTVAELYFMASLLLSILVLSRFGPLLSALWSDATEPLSLASRSLHRGYTVVMTGLIAGLALAWRRVFRYLEAREAVRGRAAVGKWGSLAWIVILLLLATMPWRLLWSNEHPRAMWRGERVYILMERGEDLVLYNPERGVTERHRRGQDPEVQPTNSVGYVFEDAGTFAGRDRR